MNDPTKVEPLMQRTFDRGVHTFASTHGSRIVRISDELLSQLVGILADCDELTLLTFKGVKSGRYDFRYVADDETFVIKQIV